MSVESQDILRFPVPHLKVPYVRPIKPAKGPLVTALLWGDTHFPHQDDDVLAIIQAIAKDTQPDFLIHMGDLVDSTDLSEKFKKNPARRETLQDEIDSARFHLARMRETCPKAEFILLEGNHEERMTRVLWNLEGPAMHLARLTEVQKVLTWPVLLGLEQLKIRFVPYGEQTKHVFLPKFIVKHGTIVRQKSAYTAHAEQSRYGKSGASGHTHRLGQFYHRNLTGNNLWLETGCSCRLDAEYAPDADWQNGCILMTFEPDTGAFQAETIYIHRGLSVFRGKTYRA